MLASTMQHSTHHHTPNPHNHHHTHPQTDTTQGAHHKGCVRRSGPEAASPRKPHQQQVSPQDPTARRTRSQISWFLFSPQPRPPTTTSRCGNNKKETHNDMSQVCPP